VSTHEIPVPSGFALSHARDARWDEGLRGFFAYRDLGVAGATQGRVGAHVIRARGASDAPGERHHHALEFQLVYVLRGWVDFDYQGVGRVRLEAGSSVVQPPGIRHAELAHSDDLEMLEITLPAEFPTQTV
jgi:quercetin dioxygenase-like cupin family protein